MTALLTITHADVETAQLAWAIVDNALLHGGDLYLSGDQQTAIAHLLSRIIHSHEQPNQENQPCQ